MEIFVRNINYQVTDDDLKTFFATWLKLEAVFTFDLRNTRKRGCALLTIADVSKAESFLARYEREQHTRKYCLLGRPVYCTASQHPPDPWLLKVLLKDDRDRLLRMVPSRRDQRRGFTHDLHRPVAANANLGIEALSCGRWEVRHSKLVFVPFATYGSSGVISADRSSLTLTVKGKNSTTSTFDVVIGVYGLHSVAIESSAGRTIVTVTVGVPPKIYENVGAISDDGSDAVDANFMMDSLSLDSQREKSTKFRESTLDSLPPDVVSSCPVFRFVAGNGPDLLQHLRAKGMGAISILQVKPTASVPPELTFKTQRLQLERETSDRCFSYALNFQVQALWINAFLSPNEVRTLLPQIGKIRDQSGDHIAVQVVQRLFNQLPYAGPETDAADVGLNKASSLMAINEKALKQNHGQTLKMSEPRNNTIPIHKVMVTPTGFYLDGPDNEPLNRVLRQYMAQAENFLRVSFLDEDGEPIFFDRDSSNERIYQQRFKGILQYGMKIGGKHFDFLGFSHSSLRSQSCWFMAPFKLNYESLTARMVINQLGDFTHIRCPAKCAARIGQAFSDSQSAVTIDPRHERDLADVERGGYTFSDGVGTFSLATWECICEQTRSSKYRDPTLFQIRYQGAKGMISLDPRLEGHQLRLRPSMIKFKGSKTCDIEICGSARRPLPMKLNRQHIKIFEDLGVEVSVFERLQQMAILKLRSGTASAENAVSFLKENLLGGSTRLPGLFGKLVGLGIDATADEFIRDVLSALIQVQLRDLKYRARILVEDAVTLYGIMDETDSLAEGEIYCSFDSSEGQGKRTILQRTVAVTRSPALHPGDVQLAKAVNVLALSHLHNCVVFSQRGTRDLPSMLSGGDLDGDLYNVVWDAAMLPTLYIPPANYSRAPPQDIGRSVTAEDMSNFFVDFMQNDQLGRIAILHQIFADQRADGTLSKECLNLAALHSTAVDFSKTGIPVDLLQIPSAPKHRPDFMSPATSTKIEKGVVDWEESQPRDTEDPRGHRYYNSDRALGQLYRAIDEDAFFADLEEDTDGSIFGRVSNENVLLEIWAFVESEMESMEWSKYLAEAGEIKENYEYNVVDSMFQYSTHHAQHLTEKEVFIGAIIGKSGKTTKRQREQAEVMKERFNREVRETIAWIRADDNALERSMACLYLGKEIRQERSRRVKLELRSFGWIAAAVCFEEMEKYQSASEWY